MPLDTAKLLHVLRWPVRDLLRAHGHPDASVRHATRERLVELVAQTSTIEQADIDKVYEDFRYGARPTFHLYLLPQTGDFAFDPAAFGGALEAVLAADQQHASLDGSEDEATSTLTVRAEDFEHFDAIDEIHVSYIHALHYIDVDDNHASVQELRHAFLWVSTTDRFVSILARDRSICRPLLRAVGHVLGVNPVMPLLSVSAWERILRAEDATRVRLLDSDGISRNWGGFNHASAEAQARARAEMAARRQAGDLTRSVLYREVVGSSVGALGISAVSATVFLTLTLGLTELRRWAEARLKPIIAAVQRDEATQPRITAEMFKMAGYRREQIASVRTIIKTALAARMMDRPSATLSEPLMALIGPISDLMRLYLLTPCSACDGEEILHCRECQGTELVLHGLQLVCNSCQKLTGLVCDADHAVHVSEPTEWILAVPRDVFRRKLITSTGENGQLDSERGYVVLWRQSVWVGNSPDAEQKVVTFNIAGQARAAVNVDSPGARITIGEATE